MTDMYIQMKGIQLYAFHGVDPQETAVGAYFYLDLKLKTDFTPAARTDRLEGTVSYAEVYEAVKDEMSIPSQLLEHVCLRIAQRLFHDFPTLEEVEIQLNKENPPMGASARSVGVEARFVR